MELSMLIHSKKYEYLPFFKGKDTCFMVWIGTVIKSLSVEADEYIYKEGEDLVESKSE
jgi:hypothetical protein